MQKLLKYRYFSFPALFCLYLNHKLMPCPEDGLQCLIFILQTVIVNTILPCLLSIISTLGVREQTKCVETSKVGALTLHFRWGALRGEPWWLWAVESIMIELLDKFMQNINPLRAPEHIFQPYLSDMVSVPKGTLLRAERSQNSGNPGEVGSPLLHPRLLGSFSLACICLKPCLSNTKENNMCFIFLKEIEVEKVIEVEKAIVSQPFFLSVS